MIKALLKYHFLIFSSYLIGLQDILFEGNMIKDVLFETKKRPKPKNKERKIIDRYLKKCVNQSIDK